MKSCALLLNKAKVPCLNWSLHRVTFVSLRDGAGASEIYYLATSERRVTVKSQTRRAQREKHLHSAERPNAVGAALQKSSDSLSPSVLQAPGTSVSNINGHCWRNLTSLCYVSQSKWSCPNKRDWLGIAFLETDHFFGWGMQPRS